MKLLEQRAMALEVLARRATAGSQEEIVLLNTAHMLRWTQSQLQCATVGIEAALRLLDSPQPDSLYPTMKLKKRLTDIRRQQEQNVYVDKFWSNQSSYDATVYGPKK